jgi:hypothetical protein
MANLKIVSLVAAEIAQARADALHDLSIAIQLIEDELAPINQKVDKLRDDVDELMQNP